MPEQPVVEAAAGTDFFEKVRQLVWREAEVELLLDSGRCAVRDDIIDLPVQPLQRLSGVLIFRARWQFFLPP